MDRQIIIEKLAFLPAEIAGVEAGVLTAQLAVAEAKDILANKEAQLYLDGTIDGKNAEIRAAQLKEYTFAERETIVTAETKMALARIELNRLLNQFKAYRTIAGMFEQMG